MSKLSIFIAPFSDWVAARNTLAGVVGKISDYLSSVPPPTDFQNKTLSNISNPIQSQDAATKNYVDSQVTAVQNTLTSDQAGVLSINIPIGSIPKVSSSRTLSSSGVSDNGTVVSVKEALGVDTGATPQASQVKLAANGSGGLQLLSYGANNQQVLFDEDWSNGALTNRDTSTFRIIKQAGAAWFYGASPVVVGSAATDSPYLYLNLGNGNLGCGGNVSPSYPIDATGDINASGVFRKAGSAGISGTFTLAKLTPTGTQGSITISGGIVTGLVAST